jgi:KUP system potassium uptake protein
MRADNHGEGGILALMSLTGARWSRGGYFLVGMGLFGAALIYGDRIITPAISVLSALEGLNVATDAFKAHIVPVAVLILLGLFAAQSRGTADVGKAFGPVMALWFVTIAVLGLGAIVRHPGVLAAANPRHAVAFLTQGGAGRFAMLGAVFLAITGGEALYADMGHIGKNPIRMAWYGLVLPALLLNYAGQTALLLDEPSLAGNPFFELAPAWAIYPLVGLATVATIIASQAIITGSSSLTRQAMQLGWFPGVQIRQTSAETYGQIYVPFVNWTMMLFTIALTVGFGSSARLAGAYGTAVSTTMLLTTALLYKVMRNRWGWSVLPAAATIGIFLIVDFAFFAANLLKIREGGWIPLVFGGMVFFVMVTWHAGIAALHRRKARESETPAAFLRRLREGKLARVPGTAIFLTRLADEMPPLIVEHVKQIGAVQETVIALTVNFEQIPRMPPEDRVEATQLADGFWHLTAHYGFVEIPNLPAALRGAKRLGCPVDLDNAVYFGERSLVVRQKRRRQPARWWVPIFGFMFRNSAHASDRFDLPPASYVEIGRQVEL